MLRKLQFAPGLDDGYRQESPPARSAPPTGAAWPIAITLRAFVDTWRETLAACREYEQLRAWGMPHDTALREALGLSASPPRRETAQPLYFAGKA